MISGNANKVVKAIRSKLLGAHQDSVLACAIAYAAPLSVDGFGNPTCECMSFYNSNVNPKVVDIVGNINELHVLNVSAVLEKTRETFKQRVAVLTEPLLAGMSVTENFGAKELDAVKCLVELLRTEFTGA